MKTHTDRIILAIVFFIAATIILPGMGFCKPSQQASQVTLAGQAEKKVEQSIQIGQQTQKERALWEQEKSKLVLEYEQLLQQSQMLKRENTTLLARHKNQAALNHTLKKQKEESARIQNELVPLLNKICERLNTLVATDPPFLKKERATRMITLKKIMKDTGITISEKYRKVMEALFIEAEYGSTIEVYQDKVPAGSDGTEDVLGNIFRLGRVSLFFLSLDETTCAVFDPGLKKWQVLPDNYLWAIRAAVEIGSKRRPVELLPLPLGRLVSKGGDL